MRSGVAYAKRAAAAAGPVVVLSLVVFLPAALAAPPANDAFAAAQVIAGESGSVSGTNAEATKEPSEPNHPDDNGGRSVWYRWTAPATGHFVFDTCTASFDTLLAVYSGDSVAGLRRIAADDDGCSGEQSSLVFAGTGGATYSIVVDGYEGAAGTFTLRWRGSTTPPANDAFAAARPLSGASGTVRATNLAAGTEPGEPVHADSTGASIWFSWTAPFTGMAIFHTCGSSFDTTLAVYTGTAVSALTPVASNDDGCQLQSRTPRFRARQGREYRIAVAGTADAPVGDVVLSWTLATRPANDDYARARRIAGARGSVTGTNAGALAEAGEPRHARVPPTATMWYRWRAPRTAGITFQTCGATTFDTVLAVYRGRSLRAAKLVDANEDACARGASRVDFLARKGVDYFVVVDGFRGDTGTFRLRWGPPGSTAACRVPDVRAITLARAREALERADCTLGRVARVRSSIVPRGRVIAQFPGPGTRLRFLGRVNLEVSLG